jgi:radical SAM superfamily enzyme YgiQ (UPF0313 family)
MSIHTLNKRRKIKTREEERIKYFMKRYRLKRKDILKNTFFINSKYGKVKVYVCVYEKAKKDYENYMSACIARAYRPLREAIFYDIKSPFGELEHPSVVGNEN